jgi:tetratricopeptide (TPR) repeat protein
MAPWRFGGGKLRVFWVRLGLWLIAGLAVLWLAVAAWIYNFMKNERAFTEVRYGQVLQLPWRQEEFKRSKAEFWVRQGMEYYRLGQYREAYELLRAGVPDVPENTEARIALARIYLMAGRKDFTRDLLVSGLEHNADQFEYVRSVLGFLFSQQADEVVATLMGKLIETTAPDSKLHQLARSAQAIAYFNRDHYAEAEKTLQDAGLLANPQSRVLLARIAWEKGLRETALLKLRELHRTYPADDEIYLNLVAHLRQAGAGAEVRRVSVDRQIKYPDRTEAYLEFLNISQDPAEHARRAEAERDYLTHFADNPEALAKLSEYAARNGRVALAEEVLTQCRSLGKGVQGAASAVVSANLEAGDFAQALARTEALGAEDLGWNEPQRVILAGFRMVALFGLGKEVEAEPELGRLLESRYLTAQSATALALRLQRTGQAESALKLLRRAVEVDALYQPALVALLRAEQTNRDLAELRPLVERLPSLRKPPADLLAELRATFESDRYLYLPKRAELVAKLAPRGGQ